jgi:hypothetical protein
VNKTRTVPELVVLAAVLDALALLALAEVVAFGVVDGVVVTDMLAYGTCLNNTL